MNTLPTPDPLAKAQCEQVLAHIRKEIRRQGPISFARYMELALYAPGLGYYSGGARKFGESGDFITAPELSPLFSRCIAKQCGQVLKDLGGGDILELGAGSGVMALEILKELDRLQQLPRRYYILELSAELKDRQRQLFKKEGSKYLSIIEWLNGLPSDGIQGVVLGNEVIDAMPVHKFKQQNGVKEITVDYKKGQLQWRVDKPSAVELEKSILDLGIDFAQGYESEINLWLGVWVASLSDSLKQGLILFIDYGFPRHEYYHPERHSGTVMCHYRHRAHADPLILTGIQDITAHVDFTAVAEAAVRSGLDVSGFTHQAGFLINCGITEMLEPVDDETLQFNVNQQAKRLMLPGEMGELFKAIALTKNYDETLLGFVTMDQRERL